MTRAPEPGRHVQTATIETSGAPGVGLAMERPARDFGHLLLSGSGSPGGGGGRVGSPPNIHRAVAMARSTVSGRRGDGR